MLIASENGHIGVVRSLVNYGKANVNVDSPYGSPASIAIKHDNAKVVDFLLDNGAGVVLSVKALRVLPAVKTKMVKDTYEHSDRVIQGLNGRAVADENLTHALANMNMHPMS